MVKKQSLLMRRVFVVLVAAMLTMALLTGAVFALLSGQTFSKLSRQELIPKASALAGLISRYQLGEISADVLSAMVNDAASGESILGAYAYAVDAQGEPLLTSSLFQQSGVDESALQNLIARVQQGETVTGSLEIGGAQLYCAGVSVSDTGGAVVLCMPMVEQLAARNVFLYALLLALIVSIPLSGVCAWLATRKLLAPLTQIRQVAMDMASGHLDARADETTPGEIGDVGRSLNAMATQLASSIYKTIVQRDRLEHIIDGLSEGIVSLDAEGRIQQFNPAVESMFPNADAQTADPRLRLIPDERVWQDFDKALSSVEPVTHNIEMDGDRVIRLLITPIFDEMDACAGVVGLFSDVTQMERLERTRRDYVANVSHEMRTPLTAMRGLIEPLKEGMVKNEEDRQRYYDIILRETMRLSRLISDLMELSRLQSGSLAIEKSTFDVGELVLDVCDRYQSIAADHGQSFRLLTDFSGCPEVYSNSDRVEQLMVILLDNAIKYTPEGGTVSVGASWNEDKVTLFVRDTGIGIAKKDLPYVFDRFYKVDRAHSGKGSGLGLSIARELLHWMGEEIWVNSKEGQGSTFSFTVSVFKPGMKTEE